MSTTRTGGFTIGFRLGWSDWQKDTGGVVKWAKANNFGALDLGRDADTVAGDVIAAGLRIGSVDLADWQGMISPDAGRRVDAIAKNTAYIKACAAFGPMNHFVVMLPENPELPRDKNFGFMVESFSQLAPILEKNEARLVIEGWPGPAALCCTPEGYRAFFKECSSQAMGINFDPSHLIRMGIDPLRFLCEFADRVGHVHGKDTELFAERLYDLGYEQPPTFAQSFGFGGSCWRYTIPGHGIMSWIEGFKILEEHGYTGCVCIELEDQNFNVTGDTEKLGLTLGLRYLEGC
jgi:sugar phosphate isomerase/epimerase